jgi:hypothetical protein
LRRLKLNPGLTKAETAELAALDASFENEDRDSRRPWELFCKQFESGLTDAERIEYAELQERFPADPNEPFREMAEFFGAIARSITDDECHNKCESEQQRAPAAAETNGASASGGPAPNATEKLKPSSPDVVSDAELLKQLMLAANRNVVPGEGIEDVGPVKVMLESGIELDDVLYTLKGKVDRRAYPGNTLLRSWSEHWFVAAVAEAYGRRVMLPVIKEKLKALGKRA